MLIIRSQWQKEKRDSESAEMTVVATGARLMLRRGRLKANVENDDDD